jgi:hypothetical protein
MANPDTTLTVSPNRRSGTSWVTFVSPQGAGQVMTSSVRSLKEAVERADRLGYQLQVTPEAYAEMVEAGVAPATPPNDYRELLDDV